MSNIVSHCWRRNKKTLYFNLELSAHTCIILKYHGTKMVHKWLRMNILYLSTLLMLSTCIPIFISKMFKKKTHWYENGKPIVHCLTLFLFFFISHASSSTLFYCNVTRDMIALSLYENFSSSMNGTFDFNEIDEKFIRLTA